MISLNFDIGMSRQNLLLDWHQIRVLIDNIWHWLLIVLIDPKPIFYLLFRPILFPMKVLVLCSLTNKPIFNYNLSLQAPPMVSVPNCLKNFYTIWTLWNSVIIPSTFVKVKFWVNEWTVVSGFDQRFDMVLVALI